MTNTELELYKKLFRKKNLKQMNITIPEYAQPLTYLALELDETLREIIYMLCYIGEDVHLKTFKNFLTKEYMVLTKDKNDKFIEKPYISKTSLDNKLKLLEFMSLIEIKEYRIRLTTQALSYFNEIYTKTDRAATLEAKLERVTKAKLLAYTSTIQITKNAKELEDINIYRHTQGFVILKSNDRETIANYKNKLNKIKLLVNSEVADNLRNLSVDYMKDKNIDDPEFEMLVIDDTEVEIKLEETIYKNYKKEIDKIFQELLVTQEWGSKICSKTKIKFNIETF